MISAELRSGKEFKNFHGISKENIDSFLAEPYPIKVVGEENDPNYRGPWEVWVVLAKADYLIAYDPSSEAWALVEKLKSGKFYCDTGADSFLEMLDGM